MFKKLKASALLFFLFTPLLFSNTRKYSFNLVNMYSLPSIREPSGLCYNPDANTLYIVGDHGDIAEISPEGEILTQRYYRNRDFEGVTMIGSILYALDENNFQILQINPMTLDIIAVHPITKDFGTFEGITTDSEGALVLVNQIRKPKKKSAGLLFLDSSSMDVIRFIETGIRDQAGICPGTATGHFYIISDTDDELYYYSIEEGIIWRSFLPGENQEGIAIDGDGSFYIAQDSGGLLRLTLKR